MGSRAAQLGSSENAANAVKKVPDQNFRRLNRYDVAQAIRPPGAALVVSNRHISAYLPERTGNYLYKDRPRRASNPPLSLLPSVNNGLLSLVSKCGRPHDQRAIDAGRPFR